MPDKPEKESKVEQAKRESNHLRGTVAATLAGDAKCFSGDEANLVKFHGAYQQYDRDARRAGGTGKADREYFFMVRVKIPGGVLTANQYLALDGIARELSGGTLRITSRQDIQLHGVPKGNLKTTIAGINRALLTTLAACGDAVRNVMVCPAPIADEPHRQIRELAFRITRELLPGTRAYHEIWLNGEKIEPPAGKPHDEEPFYGDVYLPRKFKVGVTLPEDNSIDVFTQDIGLIGVVREGAVRGYNVVVGGGLGMTHGKADTFARLATPLGYVDAAYAVEAVRIVAAVFRDHGDRADRRHARLKYVVEKWGMDAFRAEFQRSAEFELQPSIDLGPLAYKDYSGVHPQGDGRHFYGLVIENGRIHDSDGRRVQSGLRAVIDQLRPGVILTPAQNVILSDLTPDGVRHIEQRLDEFGIPRPDRVSVLRRHALACPALPTCGLAISEAERIMPAVLDEFESELLRLGLADVPFTVRMTGCPNGCSRPYTADVGLVGRAVGYYDIFVGGRLAGDRLVDLYSEKVPTAQILPTLRPLLTEWRDQRRPDEGFGDFCQRVHGTGVPKTILTGGKQFHE